MTYPRAKTSTAARCRFRRRLWTPGWLLVLGLFSAAAGPGFKTAVNNEVANAKRLAPHLGVVVLDLENGDEVYSYNPDALRILASNTKLFSAAAALDRLGPGFFFETPLLARGRVRDGILTGDLAVIGGGDPNISGRQYDGDCFGPFREWAAQLKQRGIRHVSGDLFLVHGLFDTVYVHPDWPRDQLTHWYEAPVAALSFNDSCVLTRVRPGGQAGAPAAVEMVPTLPIFGLETSARTTAKLAEEWLGIDRRQQSVVVSGRIHRGTESIDKWVAVPDPVEYFAAALVQALADEGIEVAGRVEKVAATPQDPERPWSRIHVHRSDLLSTLEVVNKRSQDFYAENVLKLLGARFCDDGSWPGGVREVTAFLTAAGLDPAGFSLTDGSGMSRNNRATPRQVGLLLRHMFAHRWGSEFLRSLPYSGERDLSWEKRLAASPYRGNVFAKTGTLNGVSTLSGYAKARSGKVYAFSILMNGAASGFRARGAQDRIVRAVIDHG